MATLAIAIILRLFVIDVISVSNEVLQPHFFPGDFLLISKVSGLQQGDWALLHHYPQKSFYSIRQISEKSEQGLFVSEPTRGLEKIKIESSQVRGRAVLILWGLPCKSSSAGDNSCADKKMRFLKFID